MDGIKFMPKNCIIYIYVHAGHSNPTTFHDFGGCSRHPNDGWHHCLWVSMAKQMGSNQSTRLVDSM